MSEAAKHTPKAGEVWQIRHSRKGDLTILLRDDVDPSSDNFFRAEIVDGTARFVSDAYRLAQGAFGLGTPGDEMSFRASLTTFLARAESTLPADRKE